MNVSFVNLALIKLLLIYLAFLGQIGGDGSITEGGAIFEDPKMAAILRKSNHLKRAYVLMHLQQSNFSRLNEAVRDKSQCLSRFWICLAV